MTDQSEEPQSLYDVLGVSSDAQPSTIKSVYRKLSAKYHPDNQDTGDEEMFLKIKAAYDVLSDEDQRKRYDRTGRTDKDRVTPKAIQMAISEGLRSIIQGYQRGGRRHQWMTWEGISESFLASNRSTRQLIHGNINRLKDELRDLQNFAAKFKLIEGEKDYIGEIFKEQIEDLQKKLDLEEDARLLSVAVEKAFKDYQYEVAPDSEGHEPGDNRLPSGGPRMIGRSGRPYYSEDYR